jgi:hypothetical protein
MDAPTKPDLFFYEPRLSMTVGGRFLVRVVSWIAYLVFIAGTFTLLLSDIDRLRILGAFLGLIFVYLLIHRNDGDVPIAELDEKLSVAGTKINVATSMRPTTFTVLERSFDTGIIGKRNFFFEVAERLLEFPEIRAELRRRDVPLNNFKQKLDEFASELQGVAATKHAYLKDSELLAITAFQQAIAAGHDFIEPSDLFSALPKLGDMKTNRLFELFLIKN